MRLLFGEGEQAVWTILPALFYLLIPDGDGSFLLQYNIHNLLFPYLFGNQLLFVQTYS